MNPKWILIILIVVFTIGVVKKLSGPDAPPPVSTSVDVDTPTPPDLPQVPDQPSSPAPDAWPPVRDGATASAAPTVNYYVVLDGSGSMSRRECTGDGDSRKIEVAVDAVRRFVEGIPAGANVGLAVFDRRDLSERVAIAANNRDAISEALTRVRAGEGTPLKSAIRLGFDKLTEQASAQLGYGEYHLVVVTDGKPDPKSEDPYNVVNDILEKSPVVVHTVGFCIDEDHVLNQPGRTYYTAASNPDELRQGLQAVLAEAPNFDATKFN
jgi:Ca-activated chloride channel family protein